MMIEMNLKGTSWDQFNGKIWFHVKFYTKSNISSIVQRNLLLLGVISMVKFFVPKGPIDPVISICNPEGNIPSSTGNHRYVTVLFSSSIRTFSGDGR